MPNSEILRSVPVSQSTSVTDARTARSRTHEGHFGVEDRRWQCGSERQGTDRQGGGRFSCVRFAHRRVRCFVDVFREGRDEVQAHGLGGPVAGELGI